MGIKAKPSRKKLLCSPLPQPHKLPSQCKRFYFFKLVDRPLSNRSVKNRRKENWTMEMFTSHADLLIPLTVDQLEKYILTIDWRVGDRLYLFSGLRVFRGLVVGTVQGELLKTEK